MRPTPTTTATVAPASSQSSLSTWHSPIPYLFGGLAAMLGLIAFALLILACSYWKLSGQQEEQQSSDNRERKQEGDSAATKDPVKVYHDKILVIMAGDHNPTFLATPAMPNSTFSCRDGAHNHSDQDALNGESFDNSEKQVTTPQPHTEQETPQQQ